MLGLDAPRWHAMLNHFPVALLLAAVVFDLGAAIWKRESLKWAGIVAGKLAEKVVEHGEAIHELMEQHERQALVTMGIFTVILVWKLYRRFALPSGEQWVTRALGIVGVVGLCYVGSAGGKLVFDHAAGIPTKTLQSEIQDRAAGHEHEPGEEDEEHEHGAPADTAKAHVDPPGTPPHRH